MKCKIQILVSQAGIGDEARHHEVVVSGGRSKTIFDEMVRLDIGYIRNWSFWLDMKILLKTVKVVLQQSGAC